MNNYEHSPTRFIILNSFAICASHTYFVEAFQSDTDCSHVAAPPVSMQLQRIRAFCPLATPPSLRPTQ